ncbi:MAG: four helix bundle protein [Prevotellaceae bacterium]|jgi:four helix bundle protein|nr:four helix bundle protein [Prevotellaceae bacterium]
MNYQYSFEKLDVWQNTRKFVVNIYKLTAKYPNTEKFGIVSQMQRAAVSICSNIAEGSSRSSLKEQVRFIEIAYGSALEIYCQLTISLDLNYITETEFQEMNILLKEITNQLNAFKNSQLRRLQQIK